MTVVMKRFSGRTFNTRGMRTVDSRIALRGPAPCAAEAVFAKAKAFLSSREARQMSASDLERELHRRHQELVGKLLQAHRDQRSPRETAGPAEGTSAGTVDGAGTVEGTSAGAVDGTSGVECPERREHECDTETTSRTVQVPRPGCASRGHDVLHPLDAALNLPSVRYGVDVCHRTTIATAARAPPCTLLPVTAALDLVRAAGPRRSTKKSRTQVEVGTIHHVKGTRFGDEAVERVNVGHFAVGDMQETSESGRAGRAACAA